MTTYQGETVWIIGASSGIGKALADELSKRGATLILSARRKSELESLNNELGANHMVLPLDVADPGQIETAIAKIKKNCATLDRAIYMAALYEPQKIEDLDISFSEQLFSVNVLGCFAFAKFLTPVMKTQTRGQIAICGSVAAYAGLPNGQPYSASKAALRNFAESLLIEAPTNIDIKLISPGFVRTPATDKNEFQMPFIIEPAVAAAAIANGLKARKFEIHFPKRFTLQMKLLAILPYWLSHFILQRL